MDFIDTRVVKGSILTNVQSHFTTPPNNMAWARDFYVYGVLELVDESHTPDEPYVYVVAAHSEPTPSRVPLVVVDPTITLTAYQIGSRSGASVDVLLHCWGRTRAERDEIATMLANVYAGRTNKNPGIPIWTSMSDHTTAVTAQVNSPIVITYPSAGDELASEGTLRNWSIVNFGLTIP